MIALLSLMLLIAGCEQTTEEVSPSPDAAYKKTMAITYNDVSVNVVIDKPDGSDFDVFVAYHGTTPHDGFMLQAANNVLDRFRQLIDRDDVLIVSVAYPQEDILFGENILQAEAALLWVKNKAAQDLGVTVNKIFLGGHSQGGYMVTRLNTMHQTNGVIANAPGPLNLVFRCELEESERISAGRECPLLYEFYGSTSVNPDAYYQRSLLNYTNGFKSDILFVQGLNDGPIHMHSWPVFKQQLEECDDCGDIQFLELSGYGHGALFESNQARLIFNQFLNSR